MKNSVKSLARCSLLTALGCVFIYLASIIPSGVFVFLAISSLCVIAARIHCSVRFALMTFAATSLLGFFIAADKSCVILYVGFFGYYPIVKSAFERIRNTALSWAAKLVLFNIVLAAGWIFSRELFFADIPQIPGGLAVMYAVFNIVFAVFDVGLSKLIHYYMLRFYRQME